jgi:hypothetical protein
LRNVIDTFIHAQQSFLWLSSMSERKVIPMFEKSAGTRQFAFRVQQDVAEQINSAAEAAKKTPTEFARLAVLEKLHGAQGREQHLQRKFDALDAKLSAIGEQIASVAFELRDFREQVSSVAFELRDFRERFDETVITAGEDGEEDH